MLGAPWPTADTVSGLGKRHIHYHSLFFGMASLEELRAERIKKLETLKARGINPYPVESTRTHEIAEVMKGFSALSKKKKGIVVAGRIRAIRGQGAIIFLDLDDGTGIFQVLLKKDETGEEALALFSETVDIGDFIECSGPLFVTKRKEKTLLAKSWRMLAKALRPLPDKWAGLTDIEERSRKRYLDTIASPESKERFLTRSRVVSALRAVLDEAGYVEVETPILQSHAGGAAAKPFMTHHRALDLDLYLRIAPELFLKELLVGGFPKVYEIGRLFRNEGIDATHNPEFTTIEYYEAYSNARAYMEFTEKIIRSVAKKIHKGGVAVFDGQKIDFTKPFACVSYADLLKRNALLNDLPNLTRKDAELKARQLAVSVADSDSREKILDNIYKKVCRPKIIQPTFITGYPVAYLPLAKRLEKDPEFADAFQVVIAGIEIVKGFSELNDPIDQRERFTKEDAHAKAGDEEAQTSDEGFLEALEYGMPPTAGVGMSVDRLAMLLTDTHNVRDIILFPTMRPKG